MRSPVDELLLSDLIDAFVRARDRVSHERMLRGFAGARVGVVASGVPEGTVGDLVSTADRPIAIGISADAEGRPVVLAFADPQVFRSNYGPSFNAEISGRAVLQTAVQNPDCHGIRLNSAIADISVLIDRKTATNLLGAPKAAEMNRPWWKLW